MVENPIPGNPKSHPKKTVKLQLSSQLIADCDGGQRYLAPLATNDLLIGRSMIIYISFQLCIVLYIVRRQSLLILSIVVPSYLYLVKETKYIYSFAKN